MYRRALGLVTALFVVFAFIASQVSGFESATSARQGSNESNLSLYDHGGDAVLPVERSFTRLTIGWRAAPPERAPSTEVELALTRWRHFERNRLEHPERAAPRLHRPRMHAGDDRPPRVTTNV